MARNDNLPDPGDDSTLEPVRAQQRAVAPMPEPGEQPDPPAGTPPADAGMSDDEIRKSRFKARVDVGLFAAGTEVRENHWSPARIRRLMAEGKLEVAGSR